MKIQISVNKFMKFKEIIFFFLEIAQIVVIALVIVLPIRYFVFQPFIVKGASMEPNFHDGDYLIVDELSYRLRSPQRGEVIVFHYPRDPEQRFIKRIIGLPNEIIEFENEEIIITDVLGNQQPLDEDLYLADAVWAGNARVVLGSDEYFVLGDNRSHSFDSRRWGALGAGDIIGRVIIRAWPLDGFAFVSAPDY